MMRLKNFFSKESDVGVKKSNECVKQDNQVVVETEEDLNPDVRI